MQRTLWVSVPFWWITLYIANSILLYAIDHLSEVWAAKGSVAGYVIDTFLKKLGEHIGILAVAIAAAGKISASLSKSSDDAVDAINKAASGAAQFVQDAVDNDVLPKLGDATRRMTEDVGRSLSGVDDLIREAIIEAIAAAVAGLPLQDRTAPPTPSTTTIPHAAKPEVDHWDDVSRAWRSAKLFLDQGISGISDGRKRRRYVGLSRYSYDAVIENLWQDDILADEQRIAALDMQKTFFEYRPGYSVPENVWHVFARNYEKLTGQKPPE